MFKFLKYLFVFLFVFLLDDLVSQTGIKGLILEKGTNLRIPDANIILYVDSTYVNFVVSDTTGFFAFEYSGITLKNAYLEIDFFGFDSEIYNLEYATEDTIRVLLTKNNFELEEVKIVHNQLVKKSGDTVTYNLDNFRDSTERNIGQLLNKLPGIDVDEGGNIKFLDIPISALTIDGDDLTGSRYQALTKTVSADLIQKIQVIQNYGENKLLASFFNSSTAIAINLITNKDARDKVNFYSQLGFGLDDYDINGNTTWLAEKHKLLINVDYNDIGKGISNFPNFDSEFSVGKLKTASFNNIHPQTFGNFEPDLGRLNKKGSIYSTLLINVSKEGKLKINSSFDKEKFAQKNRTTTNFNNESFFRVDSLQMTQSLTNKAFGLDYTNFIGNKFFIQTNLQAKLFQNGSSEIGPSFSFNDFAKNAIYEFKFLISNKLNDNLLLNTQFNYKSINLDWIAENLSSEMSIPIFNVVTKQLQNNNTQLSNDLNFNSNLYYKINSKSNVNFTAGYKKMNITNDIKFKNDKSQLFEKNLNEISESYLNLGWQYNNKILLVNFDIQNGLIDSPERDINSSYLSFSQFAKLKIDKKQNLAINVSLNPSTLSNSQFSDYPLVTRRFYLVKNDVYQINKLLLTNIRYSKTSVIPIYTFFWDLSYSRLKNSHIAEVQVKSQSLYQFLNYKSFENYTSYFSLRMGYDMLIDTLSITLKLFVNYTFGNANTIINNEVGKVKMDQISLRASFKSGFNLPVNIMIGHEPNFNVSRLNNLQNRSSDKLTFIDLILKLKKLDLTFSNSRNWLKSQKNDINVNYISDLTLSYYFKKAQKSIDVKLYNIFNNKERIYYFNDDYGQVVNGQALRERTLMVYFSANL